MKVILCYTLLLIFSKLSFWFCNFKPRMKKWNHVMKEKKLKSWKNPKPKHFWFWKNMTFLKTLFYRITINYRWSDDTLFSVPLKYVCVELNWNTFRGGLRYEQSLNGFAVVSLAVEAVFGVVLWLVVVVVAVVGVGGVVAWHSLELFSTMHVKLQYAV